MAPWALGAGALVSFTAAAGNDPQAGTSLAFPSLTKLVDPAGLVPPTGPARITWALPGFSEPGRVIPARLPADLPGEPELLAETPLPRADLKTAASDFPLVDRSRKGDPLVPVPPTLSRRGADLLPPLGADPSRLLFGHDARALPPTVLMPGTLPGVDADEPRFEPWPLPDLTTTSEATSVQSPAAAAAGSTGRAASATTPVVSRAMALSSTTPAPADATPVEIAAAPVSGPLSARVDRGGIAPDVTVATKADPDRPRYAELVNPENLGREQRCLAEAIYFEARSEPEEGQAAVAQVVLNRVRSGLYPASICGVVYQNRHRHLACQFTFACEGKALRVTEPESWDTAKRVARDVLEGKTYLAEVGGATHYHANYVRPYWARRLKKMDVIGRHVFYKLRPGQT